MTPEKEKLMITMARPLETLGDEVKAIKRGTLIVPVPPSPVPAVSPMGRIEHGIEHKLPLGIAKFNVQFNGAEFMPYEERMVMTEKFLRAMETLFKDFAVTNFTGSYAKSV